MGYRRPVYTRWNTFLHRKLGLSLGKIVSAFVVTATATLLIWHISKLQKHVAGIENQAKFFNIQNLVTSIDSAQLQEALYQHQLRTELLLQANYARMEANIGNIEAKMDNQVEVPGTVYACLIAGVLCIGVGCLLLICRSNDLVKEATLQRPTAFAFVIGLAGVLVTAIMAFKIFEQKKNVQTLPPVLYRDCCCCNTSLSPYEQEIVMRLTGFADGKADINTVPKKQRDSLLNHLKNNSYSTLYLFGGVDHRKTKTFNGENFLLSIARAQAVKELIESWKNDSAIVSLKHTTIIIYPGGTDYFKGLNPDTLSMARNVIIRGTLK